MTPHEVLMETLHRALTVRRPHGSQTEGEFVSWLCKNIDEDSWIDAAGNLHFDLRVTKKNKTLFVAHTDTVHYEGGENFVDDSTDMWKSDGKVPLGADDGAGCAILRAMMSAGVPAYYIFLRGEEKGGIGSKYLKQYFHKLLKKFDRAIAFDRRNTISVITHQGQRRTCSDAFANALSDALNEQGLMLQPDDTGVYTDTKEFIQDISECTNISAGYFSEHTPAERLDINYLNDLLTASLAINWDSLPAERDVNKQEWKEQPVYKGYQGTFLAPDDDDGFGAYWAGQQTKSPAPTTALQTVSTPSQIKNWDARTESWEQYLARQPKDKKKRKIKGVADKDMPVVKLISADPFAWSDETQKNQTGTGTRSIVTMEYKGFDSSFHRMQSREGWEYSIYDLDTGSEISNGRTLSGLDGAKHLVRRWIDDKIKVKA